MGSLCRDSKARGKWWLTKWRLCFILVPTQQVLDEGGKIGRTRILKATYAILILA